MDTLLHRLKLDSGKMGFLLAIALADAGFSSADNESRAVSPVSEHPWLASLGVNSSVEQAGARLMELAYGIWSLENQTTEPDEILIGVHDKDNQGAEWIYPLQTTNDDSIITYFYRWNSQEPVSREAEAFREAIEKVMGAHPQAHRTTILGHGCGGVLVAALIDRFDSRDFVDIHTIAAPLGRIEPSTEICSSPLPSRIPDNIRLFQWRTQHRLDDTFKDQPIDPQVVDLPGSLAVTLPKTYRGKTLGHNQAISYVADAIARARTASTLD